MEAIEEIFRSADFSKGLPAIGADLTMQLSAEELQDVFNRLLNSNILGRGKMVPKERTQWRYRGKCRNHNVRLDEVDCDRSRAGLGCECKYGFTLSRKGGLTCESSHHSACKVLFPTMDLYYASVDWSQSQLIIHKAELVAKTADAVRGGVHDKRTLKNIAIMELQKNVGEDFEIPDLFISSAVSESMNEVYASSDADVTILLDNLTKDAAKRHTFLLNEHGIVEAVSWIIPGTPIENIDVITTDVTHSVTKGHFSKWSFILGINHRHKATLLSVTALRSETFDVFRYELGYLCDCYSGLKDKEIVILTDEDGARIKAIETTFTRGSITLCWWHKKANLLKHLSPSMRKKIGKNGSSDCKEDCKDEHADFLAEVRPGLSKFMESIRGESGVEETDVGVDDEAEADDVEPCDEPVMVDGTEEEGSIPLRSFSAFFRWMRGGNDKNEVLRRLNLLSTTFPNVSKYVQKKLIPTMKYWAFYSTAWKLNFGLQTTSVQESMHASIKSHIGSFPVPVHLMPNLVDKWNCKQAQRRRKEVTNFTQTDADNSKLLKDIGCSTIHLSLQLFATPVARRVICCDILKSQRCFEVTTIDSIPDYLRYWEKLNNEPNAFRFHLLLKMLSNNFEEKVDMNTVGRLFWVCPLGDTHKPGCVLVLPNGSFASTSGMFAAYGRPDILCWAVVVRGYAYFNPFSHLHSTYLQGMPSIDTSMQNAAAKVGRPNLILPKDACWNGAVKLAEDAWKVRNNLRRQDSQQGTTVEDCVLYPMTVEMTKSQATRMDLDRIAYFYKSSDANRDKFQSLLLGMETELRETTKQRLAGKVYKTLGNTNIPIDKLLHTSFNDNKPTTTRRLRSALETKKKTKQASILAKKSPQSSPLANTNKKRKVTYSEA